MFYVYEWYNTDTQEIFYVGKGTRNRVKQTKKRNKIFEEYIENNNCSYRIIKYFKDEEEAFKYERDRILFLKSINQCKCNLDNGGIGGKNLIWTTEMRVYKSKYNPMKNEEQRKRMSENNPMKNKDVVDKVRLKKSRAVIIEGKYYESVKAASAYYKVFDTQIIHWCKRGYDRNKLPCKYADEEQKVFTLKTTNSKRVIVDDQIFNSVKAASRFLNVWSESLIRAIKNNKKCKGHVVKYDNQQPSINLKDL